MSLAVTFVGEKANDIPAVHGGLNMAMEFKANNFFMNMSFKDIFISIYLRCVPYSFFKSLKGYYFTQEKMNKFIHINLSFYKCANFKNHLHIETADY